MLQPGGQAHLALEPLRGEVRAQVVVEHLERHLPAVLRVVDQVHGAHPAAPELVPHGVGADRRALGEASGARRGGRRGARERVEERGRVRVAGEQLLDEPAQRVVARGGLVEPRRARRRRLLDRVEEELLRHAPARRRHPPLDGGGGVRIGGGYRAGRTGGLGGHEGSRGGREDGLARRCAIGRRHASAHGA